MTVKVTPFGQYVRKLRIDHDEFTKDMAARLDISPAYLSVVERGRRNCPTDWAERIGEAYALSSVELEVLTKAISDSRWYDRLDIGHLTFEDKRLIEEVVKQLPDMSESKKRQLQLLFE